MKDSHSSFSHWSGIEPLESRIAPAAVTPLLNEKAFYQIVNGSSIALHAGQGLSTAGGSSGAYLLYVLKGDCVVFTTDLNNNHQVDFNEITGIAAGDGLQLISFVDIHGDIVTNLNPDGTTLSDSDSNAANGQDGRVLLNSHIDMIQMRSLTANDIAPSDPKAAVASPADVARHSVPSSHSIYGGIYAGGGFGLADGTGGLWIGNGSSAEVSSVGPIKVGTAASGQHFSFGIHNGGPSAPTDTNSNKGGDIQGTLLTFTPPNGQVGASINGIHSIDGQTPFNIATLQAGDGGWGAAGGNISNVVLTGDTAGGYVVKAGNGGRGLTGGAGGNITNFSDLGSVTSSVDIEAGHGGQGLAGAGGNGGFISFGTMNLAGAVKMVTGSGGDGFTNGGNGASFLTGTFSTPETATMPTAGQIVTTTRNLDPVIPATVSAIGDNPNPVPGKTSDFWAAIPSVGQTQVIDFDHDGNADAVFTTSSPSQVVVLFGNGVGGYDTSRTLFLSGPQNPGAITVGDFNNDGHPDIAVASSDASFSGISVFLSKFDGLDINGAHNHFAGFTDALQSPFPVLVAPDINGNSPFTWQSSTVQVLRMVVGDFNGDGVNELAVQATFHEIMGQGITATKLIYMSNDLNEQGFGTGYFYADFGHSGFASLSPYTSAATLDTPYEFPGALTPGDVKSVATGPMKASAYTYGDIYNYGAHRHDYVFIGTQHDVKSGVTVYDNSTPALTGPVAAGSSGALGFVDTDRKYPEYTHDDATNTWKLVDQHISKDTKAALQDFALLDLNNDNVLDLVALSDQTQPGFLVVWEGKGANPSFTKVSSPDAGDTLNDQNAGISIADRDPAPSPSPENPPGSGKHPFATSGDMKFTTGDLLGIIAADPTSSGVFNGVAVLKSGGDVPLVAVEEITFTNVDTPTQDSTVTPVVHSVTGSVGYTSKNALEDPLFGTYSFDIQYRTVASAAHDYAVMHVQHFETNVYGMNFADFNFVFTTGDGGAGSVGSGGSAGNLGGGHLTRSSSSLTGTTYQADLNVIYNFPDRAYLLNGPTDVGFGVTMDAGSGGAGFINGGSAGGISGVLVEGNYYADLHTGSGGNGFLGNGGSGGSMSALHISAASEFTTGSGGSGAIGGNGGSITGNGMPDSDQFYDAYAHGMVITTGDGGHGTKRGGNGGTVQNFKIQYFDLGEKYTSGSGVKIVVGNGGSAVAGPGGNGGSIINSSPVNTSNKLRGDINLQAGNGGDGLTGGNGGSIASVINTPTDPSILPGALSLVAGNGGIGITGNGGNGGTISDVNIAGYGIGKSNLFGVLFNRVVAGQGGSSQGGTGGNGGSLNSINVSAQSGAMVVAAGAGGTGLTAGGNGGSIINSLANSAGNEHDRLNQDNIPDQNFGKVVVIAGDGGDALASLPFNHANPGAAVSNEDRIKSFGGVNGRGGNGGSIVNFQQPVALNTHVDLIAGNGGSTLNYGNSDPGMVVYVGKGGSISGATVLDSNGAVLANINGTLGNCDEDVAIKAYNNTKGDYHADETMGAFVQEMFRDTGSNFTTPVDDLLGNVGLVAGAAGRAMNGAGVTGVFNGSVSNLVFNPGKGILSMVAGAVDNIAKIQTISGVRLAGGDPVFTADLGAGKSVVPAGSPTTPAPGSYAPAGGDQKDYYDLNGLVVNTLPQTGFGLIDGVIFAANTGGLTGLRVEQA